MSILSRTLLAGSIALAAALAGCTGNTPSDKVVQEHLRQTVESNDLYGPYFSMDSWERTNGWSDNDNYIVVADVSLKSKVNYLEVLSDCVVGYESDSLSESLAESLTLGVRLLQGSLDGSQKAFIAYWNGDATKLPQPQALQDLSKRISKERMDTLLKTCDTYLMNTYGDRIDRSLVEGTELPRRYTMTFRRTEQGWMGVPG